MPQTFFKNLAQSHGIEVTVEYQMDDETCACIVARWPNAKGYALLTAERSYLEPFAFPGETSPITEKLRELDALIAGLEEACLSENEIELVEQWLSENHIQTSDVEF